MEKKIILSICITSYNRGGILKKNLEKMLSYKSDEIEFIVSDNYSTDNTMELLKTIKDERLRVYRNDENLGFMKNAITVATKARGKYLLRMNDRDYVNPKMFPEIIKWITTENVDFYIVDDGYLSEVHEKPMDKVLSYEQKVYWLRKNRHPGEIIYRNTIYQQFWKDKKFLTLDDNRLMCYFMELNFGLAENTIGTYKKNSQFIIQPNTARKKALGQLRKEVLVSEPYFLPKVEFKNYVTAQMVIKRYVPLGLQMKASKENYRIALGWATFEFCDCINSYMVCQRYGYVPPKKVYWWFVHLKFLILAVKILKKKEMFSYKLGTQMIGITIKNYYKFVKKYSKF